MRKKLSISTGAAGAPPEDALPRQGWGISGARLDKLHDMARARRRNPGEAEKLLWGRLKNQGLGGFKFSRQYVLGSSIVDFACPSRWLVVELDNEEGIDPALAALSDKKLADAKVRVLRFGNDAVMDDVEAVCAAILAELNKPFEKPRPAARSEKPERARY